jgi:hypothetical protein
MPLRKSGGDQSNSEQDEEGAADQCGAAEFLSHEDTFFEKGQPFLNAQRKLSPPWKISASSHKLQMTEVTLAAPMGQGN